MKIFYDDKAKTIPFDELDNGEVFIDSDGDISMKIYPIEADGGHSYNAIDLTEGITFVCTDTEVGLVDASLTVKWVK